MSNPADLNVVPQPDTDKNYFNFKATNLKIDQTYAIKFQWVYSDGTVSDWSPGKFVTTNTESVPSAPSAVVEGGAGFIKVSLSTFPANALRVDVRISGGIFGDGTKVTESFTAAGTKTITAPGGASPGFAYTVTLLTVTPSKINGDPSSPTTVYVTDPTANLQAEPPTLASGLSVSSAPFAVAVNWAGTYSSSDFDGFKSIDIHVRGSDVGSTATAGFSSTTQVATLTVTGTTNRQNVGLDNLRQALSLADNTAAYTAPMFFYYITRNSQDALYSVSGTPTYTRINSSSVNPTKANFVDLVNGVISIENLVAGNGNFSSYLRVGSNDTSGGARIELSGVDNFTDSNTTKIVQRGLTAYDSGNNEVLRFDYGSATPTLTIKGNGDFSGNLSIGSGNNIFKAQPATGVWLGHANYLDAPFKVNTTGYLESTSGKIGGWTINGSLIESSAANNGQIRLAPTTANGGKISLLSGGVEKITIDPVEGIVGPNITYNGTSVPAFKLTPNGNLTLYGSITVTGGNAATSDQVNLKNKTFVQNDAPTNPISGYSLVAGDLWFDANDNNKQYRWSGSAWEVVQDGTIAAAKAKADTSLQQGGNEIRNASNQITTIDSTGIKINGTSFSLNGNGTATTASANSMVINASGITAQNGSGQTTFYINASTGDAEFKGTITSGSTITGSRVSTGVDPYFGSIRMGYTEGFGSGSTLEVVGANGSVYGQLYQFNNGNELILRHGSSREAGGYPTNSAYLTLNPYTIGLGFTNSSGAQVRGLSLQSTAGGSSFTNATFENMAVSSIGANSSGTSVADTGRYFRNTVINNVAPSGSGFAIGDIWIQY
jgi:hypothetical protein